MKKIVFLSLMLVFVLISCSDDTTNNSNDEMVELITNPDANMCGFEGESFGEFTNRKMKLYIDTAWESFAGNDMLSEYGLYNVDNFYYNPNNHYPGGEPEPMLIAYFDSTDFVNICNFPISFFQAIHAPAVIDIEFSGKGYPPLTPDIFPDNRVRRAALYLTSFKVSKSLLKGEQ